MTTQEKQDRKQKLVELAKHIRAMSEDEREGMLQRFGAVFTAEGRPLSLYNSCFVLSQTKKATPQVGGFRQWQKAGRIVRKGQHACAMIYVPCMGKKSKEEKAKDESNDPAYFRLVPVFSVDQTDLIESATKPAEKELMSA